MILKYKPCPLTKNDIFSSDPMDAVLRLVDGFNLPSDTDIKIVSYREDGGRTETKITGGRHGT